MNTNQFLDACRGKSIDFKQKAVTKLRTALKTKCDGKWTEKHCDAVKELIAEIELLMVFDPDAD